MRTQVGPPLSFPYASSVVGHECCDNLLDPLNRITVFLLNSEWVICGLDVNQRAEATAAELHCSFEWERTRIDGDVSTEPAELPSFCLLGLKRKWPLIAPQSCESAWIGTSYVSTHQVAQLHRTRHEEPCGTRAWGAIIAKSAWKLA